MVRIWNNHISFHKKIQAHITPGDKIGSRDLTEHFPIQSCLRRRKVLSSAVISCSSFNLLSARALFHYMNEQLKIVPKQLD